MSSKIFIQKLNPVTNKMEWEDVDEDYDYHQEIARSGYADMLHDDERNKMFAAALKKAINIMKSKGRVANVLDIGTGTGLLSMLASKYGADSVTACEAFLPMANCAEQIIKQNNLENIKLVRKHSTDLTVGDDGDLKQRANILIAEVFDTELIGEGAIKTFNHARDVLLENDAIVIPSKGTVYAQIVECEIIKKWNELQPWGNDGQLLKIPQEFIKCPGSAMVHDIQLTMLPQSQFKILSTPVPIFQFDWSQHTSIQCTNIQDVDVINSGAAQGVFMWWDLVMDTADEIILSCAPVWEHSLTKNVQPKYTTHGMDDRRKEIPWRDHWIQAVYSLPNIINVNKQDKVTLTSCHDEFSMWFDVSTNNQQQTTITKQNCVCGLHNTFSRTRLASLNDRQRQNKLLKVLNKLQVKDCIFIILDESLVGVALARLGAKRVFIFSDGMNNKVLDKMISYNGVPVNVSNNFDEMIKSFCSFVDKNTFKKIILFSEPFFNMCTVSLSGVRLLTLKNQFFEYLNHNVDKYDVELIDNIKENVKVLPSVGTLYFVGVEFDDLYKIRAPVVACEGFNMKIFDEHILESSEQADCKLEQQPLWEYPCRAVTDKIKLKTIDMNIDVNNVCVDVDDKILFDYNCLFDGFVFWMEYQFDNSTTLSTGPVSDVIVNDYIQWDMNNKQDVHLVHKRQNIKPGDILHYSFKFDLLNSVFHLTTAVNDNK